MHPHSTMQELTEDFLREMKEQGKSPAEIKEYQRNIKSLQEAIKQNNNILNKEAVILWRQKQEEQGSARGTITNRTVRINRFLKYINAEELCFHSGSRQNLRGRQFGNLVVLEPTERRSSDRSIYWRCKCTLCGKEKEIPANQLLKGVQTSCGCGRGKRLQETNGYIDGTCLKNVLSDKVSSNNTSGYKGVFLKRGKWAASIQYKKKKYYLGAYDRLEDAVHARKEAENYIRDDTEKLLEKLQETS